MDRKTNEPSVSISDLATKRRKRELLLTNPQSESEDKHITEDFEDVVNEVSVPAYSANTMINVTFKPEETRLAEMQKVFNGLGYDALFMSHYDLANYTKYSPIVNEFKIAFNRNRVERVYNRSKSSCFHYRRNGTIKES